MAVSGSPRSLGERPQVNGETDCAKWQARALRDTSR
jgi:hypothetical protein